MALREIFAAFGFEIDAKKLDAADGKVESFKAKLETLVQFVTVGAGAAGLFAFADHISEIGDHLDKTAIRMGVSTDALQQLQFAAGQSGVGLDTLNNAVGRLQDLVGDAMIDATGPGAKAMHDLGLSFKDAGGQAKSADALLTEVADKIAATDDPTKRVTLAMNAFGKAGRELLPLLAEGSDGIAALRKEQQALGGGFSKEAVKASANYNDALGRLSVTFQSVKGRIAVVLLPVLQRLVDFGTKVASGLLELSKNSALVEAAIGTLAAALGLKLIPTIISLIAKLAPIALPVAALALLVLIVDDLIVAFRGGKSVIVEWVDALFGVGAAERAIRKIKDTVEDLTQGLRDGIDLLKLFAKSKGGFRFDLLSTEDLLSLNRIGAGASRRAGGDGKGFLDDAILGGGRGDRLKQAVQDRVNPTVPGRLSREFVPGARPGAGTTVSVPTSLQINVPPGSSSDHANFIADVVSDVLGKRNDEVIAAMQTVAPK